MFLTFLTGCLSCLRPEHCVHGHPRSGQLGAESVSRHAHQHRQLPNDAECHDNCLHFIELECNSHSEGSASIWLQHLWHLVQLVCGHRLRHHLGVGPSAELCPQPSGRSSEAQSESLIAGYKVFRGVRAGADVWAAGAAEGKTTAVINITFTVIKFAKLVLYTIYLQQH